MLKLFGPCKVYRMNVLLVVLGAVVFCGTKVSAECDSLTQQKLQECSLNSHMFDPQMSPKSLHHLRRICEQETHHVVRCYNTHVQECVHNKRESDLINMLVDIKGMRRGFDYLCGNMSVTIKTSTMTSDDDIDYAPEDMKDKHVYGYHDYDDDDDENHDNDDNDVVERKPQCVKKLKESRVTQCVRQNMYNFKRRIMGVSDMKRRLDELCSFFESLRYCATHALHGECDDVGHLYDTFLLSFKYPYCKMSDRERRRHVDEYTGRSKVVHEERKHTLTPAVTPKDSNDGVGVFPHCDAMTHQKLQECTLNSHLLDPQMSPKSEYHLRQFCEKETHNIVRCINTHVQECIHNAKEMKMINILVDIQGMNRGFDYLCGNISVLQRHSECLDELKKPSFTQCERQDIYNFKRRIMGVSDMKRRLDELCGFFDSLRRCFTNPFRGECEVVGHLYDTFLLSFKYPYCKMTDSERRRRVDEYNSTPDYPDSDKKSEDGEVKPEKDLKTFYHYRKTNSGITLKYNLLVLLGVAIMSHF